jgi:hypothetical protein
VSAKQGESAAADRRDRQARLGTGIETRIDVGHSSRFTGCMKLLPLSVLLAVVIGFGCATPPQPQAVYRPLPPPDNALPGVHPLPPEEDTAKVISPSPESLKQQQEAAKKAAREEAKREKERAKEEKVIVSPDNGLHGKVATYNDAGRFVVLTIPPDQMPKLDAELFIYRDNMKVGEAKVTGPYRDDNVVADLVNGAAQAGDEVRDK